MLSKNNVFENSTVSIDGNTYEDCTFQNCTLVYSGGAVPSFVGCTLYESQFSFIDGALRTLDFMHHMYFGGFRPVVDELWKSITTSSPKGTPNDEQ